MNEPLLTVDVAHPPRSPEAVEVELLEIWHQARNQTGIRVVKVIHGHGSTGHGGSTREITRNWLFRNRSRFRGVIEGERYSITDPATMELRREVGLYPDGDLDRENRGITLVWIR